MSGMAGLNFKELPGLQATFADRAQSHRIDNGYLWVSYAVHHVGVSKQDPQLLRIPQTPAQPSTLLGGS